MSDQEGASASEQPALETSFSGRTIKPGDLVAGTIVKITGSVAFVDFGARSQGYIQLSELRGPDGELQVQDGDTVQAEVVSTRSGVELSYRKARDSQVLNALRDAWKSQTPVDGRIVGVNKGGFEVRVEGIRAFCPATHLTGRQLSEPAREVGNTYAFRITEFSETKGLVVSRKDVLEAERRHAREVLTERIKVGERLQGTVTHLKDFGAFVDIGEGVEGMIHVSEISHARVNHPSDALKVGEAVEVEVLRVEPQKGRVALSMKALESNPFRDYVREKKVGDTVTGTVDRLQDFGAFVKLAEGVDGLLHISGISATERVENPADVLAVGQALELVIEKIDRERERIGLLTPEVAEAKKPVDISVKVGDIVKGPVTRVEKYGVFIEIADRLVGLCPNPEMATDRNADHRRMFPIGTELEVKVVEVDRHKGRVRLSRKALLNADEEKAMADYKRKQKEEVPKALGTFGDLLKDFLNK